MIIREVTIENFRCYYGKNSIDFNDGLTLVIGDNGDGKTTFFEALEWLFNTSTLSPELRLISQKKRAELAPSEIGTVKVGITFEHDGKKKVEKSFDFEIKNDEIITFNSKFIGFEEGDFDRLSSTGGGNILDRCFDAAIRKYSLFKGEKQLNVFNKPEAMNYLVRTFSNIRDFDPYLSFSEYACEETQKIYRKTIRLNDRNAVKERRISADIKASKRELHEKMKRLDAIMKEVGEYDSKINDYERNQAASETLNHLNSRIESLKNEQAKISIKIKEDYSTRLLDEEWILCGFPSILEEFDEKISNGNKVKRRIEQEERIKQGRQRAFDEISASIAKKVLPLPITIPDKDTMQELLDDEICKVCGRKAPKGSDAYNFMQRKIDELNRVEQPKEKEHKLEEIFANNFMKELDQVKMSLNFDKENLNQLNLRIEEDIHFNNKMRLEGVKIKENIVIAEEDKMKLLAQTDNLSEQELENLFHNMRNWYRFKVDGEKQIPMLKSEIEKIEKKLAGYNEEYDKLASNSSANIYAIINTAFNKIKNSFISAKNTNTQNFLKQLEEKSNEYLKKLNFEDFTGVIHIKENYSGGAEIRLYDNQGQRVHDPNTALETTMFMSVLFAISELTSIRRDNDYPLIFDAPTSSFSDAKEISFFNVIANVEKQCIIFTKSFLKADRKTGKNELDLDEIDKLNGKVYRIAKKRPFDSRDLSTIEMEISQIKN